jgi:hypothetical protein
VFPSVAAAIGDDGTAVATADHPEADTPGEKQSDGRLDAAVHPPNGAWDSGTRLSPPDTNAQFAEVGVDASGAATVSVDQTTSEGATSSLNDDDSALIVRRYSPSNRLWSGPEDVSGAKPGADVGAIRLDVAQSGRAVVAFQLAPDGHSITTEAARRPSTTASFGPSQTVDAAPDSAPTAVGVAPDGSSYVATSDSRNNRLGVARASASGSFSEVENIGPAGIVPSGAVAFRGNDAFIGWDDDRDGVHAAIWPADAPRPDAARDLDANHHVQGFRQLESDRDGSIVAVWQTAGLGARTAAFDGGGPALTGASVPDSGQAGQPIAMSASFADFWSPLGGDPEWDFGDGTAAAGGSVSHTYATAGTFTVTVRSRDARGNERTRTFPVTIAAAAQQPPAGDSVKPTVTLKLPAKKVRRKRSSWKTLKGTVADSAPSSGVARVEVQARLGKAKAKFVGVNPKGSAWKFKAPKLTRGTWTFRVRAVDNAGNVSKTITQKVRLR